MVTGTGEPKIKYFLNPNPNETAAKQETTVQDCVAALVSVKPLDSFNVTSGQFTVVFVATDQH